MSQGALRLVCVALAGVLALFVAPGVSTARASFGIEDFSVIATAEGGSEPDLLAGSHPYSVVTDLSFRLAGDSPGPSSVPFTDGDLRNLHVDLPPGFIENPGAVTKCSQAQFHAPRQSPYENSLSGESCPDRSQIGVVRIDSSFGGGTSRTFGVFNLEPPPGFPSQIGFNPYGAPVTFTPHLRENASEYGVTLDLANFPQQFNLYGFRLVLWGTPWNIVHNAERGNCLNEVDPDAGFGFAKCSTGSFTTFPHLAYLTLPANCDGPLITRIRAESWQQPDFVEAVSLSHDSDGEPQGLRDCQSLPFEPLPIGRLTNPKASSPSGFDFILDGEGKSLIDPIRRVGSQVKKAVVALPEGVTLNPSIGAGLGYCTPSQYAAETVSSPPGANCPNASKIGELSLDTPLFEGAMSGSLFLAQPDDPATGTPGTENPFDSLLALYMVGKAPDRGVMIKVAGKVNPDPASGRLVVTFDDLPQLPYTHFNVHLRDTQRSPLATPATCGSYGEMIDFSPWIDPDETQHVSSQAQIAAGFGGGPCLSGPAPFTPQAQAGTLNRNAGSYTPFYLHLTRTDIEQEITSYSAQLPPGLTGKLAGIPYCPDAAIEAAKRRRGFAEAEHPSCPAASRIGHTIAGYGLSSVLAYAPGGLYLAGPFHGQPFSIVAIDSATVGPFDLGVIVVRSAIEVDPLSAQVGIDSSASDPIPHIVQGIPLHLRDIRVYIDRPQFTLNPTNCEHFSIASTLNGSGEHFADLSDDRPATVADPFQVSNCSARDFAPRLDFKLNGGTKRGDYPALRAELRPRPGDANLAKVTASLPPSIFLAQEHVGTICTRTQFASNSCPTASIYGHARAISPLLGQPLEGPVYLRASNHDLPDLVADLRGQVRIEVVGRIDSTPSGGLRGSFETVPDAPVTKFVMTLRGKGKGLLVNAANLCDRPPFAKAALIGQNNTGERLRPPIDVNCKKSSRRPGQDKGGRSQS